MSRRQDRALAARARVGEAIRRLTRSFAPMAFALCAGFATSPNAHATGYQHTPALGCFVTKEQALDAAFAYQNPHYYADRVCVRDSCAFTSGLNSSCSGHCTAYADGHTDYWTANGVTTTCGTPVVMQKNVGPSCGGGSAGNPINVSTGNKVQAEDDYLGAHGSLRVQRYYNSSGAALPGHFGEKWRSTFDRQVLYGPNGTRGLATAYRPDGRSYLFAESGGTWIHDADVKDSLTRLFSGPTPIGWRLQTADDGVEIYDATGRLTSITSRTGLTQTLTYSGSNERGPVTVTDSFNRTLQFTYETSGTSRRVRTMTDPAGQVYTYTYDGYNNLALVDYPDATARTYHYENNTFTSALTGITDENGARYATWAYDAQGRAYSSKHAGDVDQFTLTFGANESTTVNAPLGATDTRQFTSTQGVLKLASMVGEQTGYCDGSKAATYDANGNVSSRTDFNDNVTNYVFDLSRNLETSRTEAVGTSLQRTITTQWHATFRLPTQIDEPGRRTTFTYDTSGNRLTQTILDTATNESRTTTWTYNSLGQVLTVNGPRDASDVVDLTTYHYGSQGNLDTITNALGQVTTIDQYDAHGNPGRITDPNGVVTTLAYDLRQRLISRTAANETTSFEYDGVGQLKKVTLPDGSYLSYTYDGAHRLTDITDSAGGGGNRIHYTLDSLGNRIQEEVIDSSNTLKRKQSQVFNTLGRLQQIKNAAGDVLSEFGYDNQGNRTSQLDHIDATSSATTTFTPDALNRIKQVTDAASGVTQYGYNALDQLISVTDPKSLVTSYTLNALGDVKQQVSPDTGNTSYTLDSAGNRKSQTDARNVTASYSYDALNRLTSVDYPGAAEDVTYSYDGTNYSPAAPNGVGRLTGIVDESGTTTMFYDARGNVTLEKRLIGGTTYTTSYSYDSADRAASITYPSGRLVTYTRNALGQVTKVQSNIDGVTTTVAEDIAYMPFGGIKSYTLGNGISVARSFDDDYRLEEIKDLGTATVQDLKLHYDLRSNLSQIEDLVNSSRTQDFGFDALSRLTSADGAYGLQGFTYDGVGNRLTRTVTPPGGSPTTDTYTYPNDSHRLSSQTSGPSYGYNAVGSVTSTGVLAPAYNNAGRMSAAGGMSAVYNASGQRVKKTANGVTTIFHYDRAGQLIAEQPDSGLWLGREYVWLGNIPLAVASTRTIPDYYVDNADGGFSTSGAWTTASASGQYGSSYAERGPAVEVPGDTVGDDLTAGSTVEDPPSPPLVPYSSTMYAPPSDSDGTFTVLWTTSAKVNDSPIGYYYELFGYELEMAHDESFLTSTRIYAGGNLSHQLSALPTGSYYFRARALWKRCLKINATCDLGTTGTQIEPTPWYQAINNWTTVTTGCASTVSGDGCPGRATYTGNWVSHTTDPFCTSADCQPYPGDVSSTYHQSAANLVGTDVPTFTWKIHLPGGGRYRVYAHWPLVSGAGQAKFSFSHRGGVADVPVDQTMPSGPWYSLGSYDFDTTVYVNLSPELGSNAIADAVKLVPVEDIALDFARWAPIGEDGTYDVFARWPSVSGASTAAPFSILDAAGTIALTKDQSANTGTWNLLGSNLTFDDSSTQGIKLGAVWDQTVLADAMHFVPVAEYARRENLAYFHVDQLNTPQKLTDAAQAVVWEASYEPFGKASVTKQPNFDNPLRFPGQYFDAETGLHQNWHRDNDPSIGRYLQSDPLGLDAGLNTYAYVDGNPINATDPTGLLQGPWPPAPATTATSTLVRLCLTNPAACVGAAGAAGYLAGSALYPLIDEPLGDAIDAVCRDKPDDPECSKASKWQLKQAQIKSEHDFKTEWGAVPNSRFDICACKDGSIQIKAQGQCGKPGAGIVTDARWR